MAPQATALLEQCHQAHGYPGLRMLSALKPLGLPLLRWGVKGVSYLPTKTKAYPDAKSQPPGVA